MLELDVSVGYPICMLLLLCSTVTVLALFCSIFFGIFQTNLVNLASNKFKKTDIGLGEVFLKEA